MASDSQEDRALDALIVSALRMSGADETDIEHLPRLTDEEKTAMESLGPDFVERLLAEQVAADPQPVTVPEPVGQKLTPLGMARMWRDVQRDIQSALTETARLIVKSKQTGRIYPEDGLYLLESTLEVLAVEVRELTEAGFIKALGG